MSSRSSNVTVEVVVYDKDPHDTRIYRVTIGSTDDTLNDNLRGLRALWRSVESALTTKGLI